jgi:hypothetical protein
MDAMSMLYMYACHVLSLLSLFQILLFSLLWEPSALDSTVGAWEQHAFELNLGTTTSVLTVIKQLGYLQPIHWDSPRLSWPHSPGYSFFRVILPRSLGRPYWFKPSYPNHWETLHSHSFFMLVHLHGVQPEELNSFTQHSLMGKT